MASQQNNENGWLVAVIIFIVLATVVVAFWEKILCIIAAVFVWAKIAEMFETKDERHERWRRERLAKYGRC